MDTTDRNPTPVAMQRVILTSIAYMPPIEFFVNLKGASAVWIEQHENYQKQTFRNRAQIYASNGVQNLIIPVQRAIHTKIKDTLIDYRTPGNAITGGPSLRRTIIVPISSIIRTR